MGKSVTFKVNKPTLSDATLADAWVTAEQTAPSPAPDVKDGRVSGEAMKRFTIDVPLALHSRIKVECARRGLKMADVLRALLEREFTP